MLVDQQILVVYDWPFGATVATVLVAIVLAVNIVSVRVLDRRRTVSHDMSNRLSGPVAWLLFPITAAMMIFILAPLLVTVAISISDTPYVVFPPRGFTIELVRARCCRTPISWRRCGFSSLLAVGGHRWARCCSACRRPSRLRAIEFPGRDAVGRDAAVAAGVSRC